MLALILTAIVLVIVLIMFVFNRKNLMEKPKKYRLIWAGVILAPAALFWLGYESSILSFNMQTRTWEATPGVIVQSAVSGERAIHPAITVQYEIGDISQSFTTDLFAPGFGVRSNRRDQAEKLVAQYQAGDTVTVYVNPRNLLQARIHPGPAWNNYLRTGLAMIFTGLGFWLILVSLARRKPKVTFQQ
ncbi:MAG: DUF3592 domain-containing protein [Lentisphaeria bacterium]|nr:DUF3592 domain-containing protein [Candidatus Neomarinimicrobiota bacterium]MCF7842739.1 DUF3592 domain-containing protein [Lentisphaeria bacterium]